MKTLKSKIAVALGFVTTPFVAFAQVAPAAQPSALGNQMVDTLEANAATWLADVIAIMSSGTGLVISGLLIAALVGLVIRFFRKG